MTAPPHDPQSNLADQIRFACGHCGTLLEVPGAFAGVSGPCPVCGGEIAAPRWTPAVPDVPAVMPAARNSAPLLTKPPPLRDLPPPLAPVDGLQTLSAVETSGPFVELQTNGLAPSANGSIPKASRGAVPVASARERTARTAPLFPKRERGIFDAVADSNEHRLDIHRAPRPLRRRGWRRWLDIGIVGVFTGLALAVILALRFTGPLEVKSVPGLPPNLTELVAQETKNLRMREQEAEELARAAVNRYLGAASERAAASHLLTPPEGLSPPPFPPFSTPLSGALAVQSSRRIPGTDRFLVVVGPAGQSGPAFVVEQTESGPRIHGGAITQQSAGLFEKFIAASGDGEATLYAKVKPTAPADERDYRAKRPDLSGFLFVDVGSAFPVTGPGFVVACIKPGSEAARDFARRAHDVAWRPAIVHLRWQRHREAGPYAELENFVPGTWSGDRMLQHGAAHTAAVNP